MNVESIPAENPLILKLLSLSQNRGAMAELRRFWSPATLHYAYPILGRLGVPDPRHPDAITAALYAVHPHHSSEAKGVGSACQRLAGGQEKESFERHFRRLLASEELGEVAEQLYRISKRLHKESIPLNYNKLLWDLRTWSKKSDEIKTRWAMDFWHLSQNPEKGDAA